MRLMRSRKAESAPVGWGQIAVLFYVIFMGVVTIIFVYNMYALKQSDTQIPREAFERMHYSRLLLASNCLAYESEGRTHAWTMDWSRFVDSTKFNACMPFTDGTKFNVTLITKDGSRRSVLSDYYRTPPYDLPIVYPVLVRDAGITKAGTLLIQAGRSGMEEKE